MANERLTAQIAALQKRFLAQLPEKMERLQAAIAKISSEDRGAGAKPESVRATARGIAHGLAGSGGTFGFPQISETARVLESELHPPTMQDAINHAINQRKIEDHLTRLQHVVAHALDADASLIDECLISSQSTYEEESTAREPDLEEDSRRTVFLVEDDTELASSIALQLGHFGYKVHSFSSPADMRDESDAARPLAILMDIGFPEGEFAGTSFIGEKIPSHLKDIPVLFISARGDFKARLEAVRAGGSAYFRKPVEISALAATLDSVTKRVPPMPFRVLIVEDDESIAELYAETLRSEGIEAEFITNPGRICQPLAEFSPDLILMDLYMPECDGIELASLIRQQPTYVSVPIVFLSCETRQDKQLAALKHGADDFLTKPIHADELVSVVKSRVSRARELRGRMDYDGLTGLLNHSKIMARLEVELARAHRLDRPIAFAMLDLDRFKSINDTYGHAVGDRVLRSLSHLLQQRLRRSDIAGRYGGEEFAIILTDTDAAGALRTLDELRADFAQLNHVAGNHEFKVTFSCGIADFPSYNHTDTLSAAADAALYAAKRLGRNRIEVTPPIDSPSPANKPGAPMPGAK